MTRPRLESILLWLWLPITPAALLLNLFGVLDTGWMLGIIIVACLVSLNEIRWRFRRYITSTLIREWYDGRARNDRARNDDA